MYPAVNEEKRRGNIKDAFSLGKNRQGDQLHSGLLYSSLLVSGLCLKLQNQTQQGIYGHNTQTSIHKEGYTYTRPNLLTLQVQITDLAKQNVGLVQHVHMDFTERGSFYTKVNQCSMRLNVLTFTF